MEEADASLHCIEGLAIALPALDRLEVFALDFLGAPQWGARENGGMHDENPASPVQRACTKDLGPRRRDGNPPEK
jgi:hypothetical protein